MRTAATIVPLLLLGTLSAQDRILIDCMERFAKATQTLDRSIAVPERTDAKQALEQISATSTALRDAAAKAQPGSTLAAAVGRSHWLDRLDTAVAHLREPEPTRERDRWDLHQLRAACTGCHLEVRGEPGEHGLFPNRDNAIYGTLRIEPKDGSANDDHSGVVVFLDRDGPPAAPLPRNPAISQRGRRFEPTVLAVTIGTTVRFPNDDVVFHNVFSLSRGNAFDLETYSKGQERTHRMQSAGLVKVHCNIHPDMSASVLVLNTDRTAISANNGFWALTDVPDGDYTLRAWHPLAEVHSQALQVRGGRASNVALVVRETRPRVQHTDKNGRPYKKKY